MTVSEVWACTEFPLLLPGPGWAPPLVTTRHSPGSVECWQCRQADVRADLSPAVPPHHNIRFRLEQCESWKIDNRHSKLSVSMSGGLLNLTDYQCEVKPWVLTQWRTPVLAPASKYWPLMRRRSGLGWPVIYVTIKQTLGKIEETEAVREARHEWVGVRGHHHHHPCGQWHLCSVSRVHLSWWMPLFCSSCESLTQQRSGLAITFHVREDINEEIMDSSQHEPQRLIIKCKIFRLPTTTRN